MSKIKFSKCPIGKHKGEYWEKLKGVPAGAIVKLYSMSYPIAPTPSLGDIKHDTFADWTDVEWRELMEKFYGSSRIVLLRLDFRYVFPDTHFVYRFSTYRAYDWKKHIYYEKNVGKEFQVVLT